MGDPCEICGDVGFAKRIRICDECKVSREHVYCRKPMGETLPDVWLCEKCELGVTASPEWRKNSKSRKTMFLNPEDAIMLASGAKKFTSSSRRVVNLTSTTMKPKPPTRFTLPNMGGNFDRPTRPSSPAFFRGTISSANQQEVLSSKDLKGKNVLQVPIKETNSGKDMESHTRTNKMVKKEAPCPPQPLGDCTPVMSSRNNMTCADASADTDRRKSGAGNGELPEEKKVQGPAYSSSWMGDFRVCGTGTLQDLNVAIEAHTPDKVLWKVLEFSKKLPEVLSFELLQRTEVWTGIFQDYCPGKDDIGLYLFSRSNKMSENYVRLVKFMDASDSVLFTCVNGVELLVFPSKCLSSDSQKVGGEHFLWGLFRRVKKKKAEEKARDKLPLQAQAPGPVPQNGERNTEDTSCHIPIPREPSLIIPKIPLPSVPDPISRNFTFLAQPPVLPGVRTPETMDFPLSFEEFDREGASSQQL